jgi:hypothetical protein
MELLVKRRQVNSADGQNRVMVYPVVAMRAHELSNAAKNGGVAFRDLSGEWFALRDYNDVRFSTLRNMAEHHAVAFRPGDFRDGEILVSDRHNEAIRLAGRAAEFCDGLFQLDQGLLSREEFLHRFAMGRP